MTRRFAFVLVLAAAAVSACSHGSHGTAPTIDMLSLDPATAKVGAQTTITATVHFTDPDGDIDTVDVEIEPPSAQATTMSADIVGADGETDGKAEFLLTVVPPEAGDYGVRITVVDTQGNRSNELDATFTVQ